MFATFTLGYNHVPRTSAEQLQPFERGRIIGVREAEWTYRSFVAHIGRGISLLSMLTCGINLLFYIFFHRRPIQQLCFFPVGLSSLSRHS